MNPSLDSNNSSTGQKYSHISIERENSLPFPEPANGLRRMDIRYVKQMERLSAEFSMGLYQ
jgi:hypothetical protein